MALFGAIQSKSPSSSWSDSFGAELLLEQLEVDWLSSSVDDAVESSDSEVEQISCTAGDSGSFLPLEPLSLPQAWLMEWSLRVPRRKLRHSRSLRLPAAAHVHGAS